MTSVTAQPSFLATRRGKLTLALLAAVAFIDFVDASIVNIALPSIRRDLGFSQQGLQWVPSAYLLTYGGFMLLGGRAADLLGRRRVLVAGELALNAGCPVTHSYRIVPSAHTSVGGPMSSTRPQTCSGAR